MAKELSKDLINLTVLNSVLESELDNAFRSEIFSEKKEIDAAEVSKVILEEKGSFASYRREILTPTKRRQSVSQGIITSENEDWKSAVPDSTLQWLQGLSSASNFTQKSDGNESSDSIAFERK